jgi:hypothetical protein
VGGLNVGDFLQVVAEGVGEPSFDEVGLGVVGKTLAVEFVFQMLKSECVVEDTDYRMSVE